MAKARATRQFVKTDILDRFLWRIAVRWVCFRVSMQITLQNAIFFCNFRATDHSRILPQPLSWCWDKNNFPHACPSPLCLMAPLLAKVSPIYLHLLECRVAAGKLACNSQTQKRVSKSSLGVISRRGWGRARKGLSAVGLSLSVSIYIYISLSLSFFLSSSISRSLSFP